MDVLALAKQVLEEYKANDIQLMDVKDKTTITDYMLIASGTSSRHILTLAQSLVEAAKKHQLQPLGVEGEKDAEWVLVDLGDVIVHMMLPQTRAFYNLEGLWSVSKNTTPPQDDA